ncbi:1,4-dihydroxy-2-naphthoate octaprenyltransferase [Blattabacterium cuenoti]|uniref:1,4-dihydroxy-2-naphthoate octaprenyltransferase n=1 Tax=Blattabacterium cuenoti TaxID=1653831 RepID=UPI00163C5539|nr:1,4-dihydroxy-2-naphthoate octaprenyltransferase [Blattabacterium cuenoti]
MKKSNIKYWINTIRLETLPLSFSGVTLSFLVSKFREKNVNVITYIFCVITALLLQVLANISNDYGDCITGIDNNYKRIGPKRPIHYGLISLSEMKKSIFLFSILSFLSGSYLIYQSISYKNISIFIFCILGILFCIFSSIKYSIGIWSIPYGYIVGMGDLSVFIFFGFFSVLGSYFLYTHTFCMDIFLLSLSMGLLNVSVLNINNMRDIENDYDNGKYTIAGLLGIKRAKLYHIISILIAIFSGMIFILLNNKNIYQWVPFIISIFFFVFHIKRIIFLEDKKLFNLELRRLVSIIFLYGLSIGISNFIN